MSEQPSPRNPVGWFEIYVQDLDRAKAFYEGVFQISLTPMESDPASEGPPMKMLMFPGSPEMPGCCGALMKMDNIPSTPGGTLVYFSCTDCAEESARVAEHGGEVCHEKFSIGQYGYIAMVNDSEGNTIGLHSQS